MNDIDHYIIYSCYIKKDYHFPQLLKEEIYIALLKKIVEAADCELDIIFDSFNKNDFETNIINSISSIPNVLSITSCDSQKNPGLQFVDNLCSACRHYMDGNDINHFYDIIKENIKEV